VNVNAVDPPVIIVALAGVAEIVPIVAWRIRSSSCEPLAPLTARRYPLGIVVEEKLLANVPLVLVRRAYLPSVRGLIWLKLIFTLGFAVTAPVTNYMELTDDACMTGFTAEQIQRMRCTLATYRPLLATP